MRPSSRFARLAALGLGLALAVPAFAGARDELNRFTGGLKGLEGSFEQQVFDANGRSKERSSGIVAVSAPRLFRWEYKKPFAQLIVADGQKVWVYEPDLQQATVKAQGEEERNSPLVALFEPARLDRQFDVSEEAVPSEGLQWLTLTPKIDTEASFQMARLGFGPQGLSRMQVVDLVGQKTEIRFDAWKRNPSFAAGTFKFVPGKGVDVVGE
ncbi:outer membrane lipoprotein chaperone LolA [Pseudoxanthomonas suwonensis]|jgi:periplasmic chaperone LolA|uniref:outer membrane lipoprotein chaperone LolA n=1 Tax=Pseudoxanthomonas suwonensis TaxID=314722 RepID=UPI00138F5AAF|nr:outer membrane lipoprotein chaperone LolA [Pseudoxanthomonas suwonensis]KAF1703412.1 outer membrane lipoprotein carrier protein LolA [Pseudoxanthomonas suwonensis]